MICATIYLFVPLLYFVTLVAMYINSPFINIGKTTDYWTENLCRIQNRAVGTSTVETQRLPNGCSNIHWQVWHVLQNSLISVQATFAVECGHL